MMCFCGIWEWDFGSWGKRFCVDFFTHVIWALCNIYFKLGFSPFIRVQGFMILIGCSVSVGSLIKEDLIVWIFWVTLHVFGGEIFCRISGVFDFDWVASSSPTSMLVSSMFVSSLVWEELIVWGVLRVKRRVDYVLEKTLPPLIVCTIPGVGLHFLI